MAEHMHMMFMALGNPQLYMPPTRTGGYDPKGPNTPLDPSIAQSDCFMLPNMPGCSPYNNRELIN